MSDRIESSSVVYSHRSSAWLFGGFAIVAFTLGIVGLYGVVSYSVGHRTREIGVRMALGADRRAVYGLILGDAVRLAGAGACLGIAGSLAAARLMRSFFYEVQPWDGPMFVTVAAVLMAAALLASFAPARNAASIRPTEALRAE